MMEMRGIFLLLFVVLQHNCCMAVDCPTISETYTVEKLSENLMSACSEVEDKRNDEIEFASSSYHLHRLGLRYLQNAREALSGGREIEQKRNYTRAAALLYGAKVRYETFLAVLLGTTENNDALQSCINQMEKAFFEQMKQGDDGEKEKETVEKSIQRRNPISKCIKMIQHQEGLLVTRDMFLIRLEERERTYPGEIDNVENILTGMNLLLSHGRNMEAVRYLSANLTCLRNDTTLLLNNLLSTISDDLSGILDVTVGKDQVEKLNNASHRAKSALRIMREEDEEELERIGSNQPVMNLDMGVYIESVNQILQQNTENYIQLFKNISEDCIKVIGKPPTEYAVMSFGSTSRSEVTLYSDFEHAILYRPTTETTKKQVQEYYLWYTVLFHITVISLEETMIHAVNFTSIPLLIDYHDAFTPRGIAFDSMVEGGNKNPFGDENLHLIFNVDYTKVYLGPEQKYIANLLARSRFAFGDDTIYDEFALEVKEAMWEKGTNKILQDQVDIIKNTGRKIISGEDHSNLAKRYEDPKNSLYRPLTVLLELFARVYRYSDESTDGFIQYLINQFTEHYWEYEMFLTLQFDVALASEVRLKVYSTYGRQMYEVSKEEIFGIMDKTEYVRMFTEIVLLRNTLLDLNESCSKIYLYSEIPNPISSFQATGKAIMTILPEKLKVVGNLSSDVQEKLTRVESFAASVKEKEIAEVDYEWTENKNILLQTFAKLLTEVDEDWGGIFTKAVQSDLSPTMTECSTTRPTSAVDTATGGDGRWTVDAVTGGDGGWTEDTADGGDGGSTVTIGAGAGGGTGGFILIVAIVIYKWWDEDKKKKTVTLKAWLKLFRRHADAVYARQELTNFKR